MQKTNMIRYHKTMRRAAAVLLCFALILSLLSGIGCIPAQAAALHDPAYDDGVREAAPGAEDAAGRLHAPVYDAETDSAAWDCVWFGSYWQNDTNGDGAADKNDKKEPIKWRVLSVDGDDVFLLADTNLDVMPYNETYTDVTWEDCTLRSWLNGYDGTKNGDGRDYTEENFIDAAFTAAEQAAIRETDVVNADNPYYGTSGGNDTADKVFLLSIAETSNPAYGFPAEFNRDSYTRMALNTAYVAGHVDMSSVGEADWWWLRSPGYDSVCAADVDYYGYGYDDGNNVDYVNYAVRPALHLHLSTLSSSAPLSYAGTVCSDGTVTDAGGDVVAKPTAGPTAKPTAGPTAKPTAAPTTKPTAAPTAGTATKPTATPTQPPAKRPAATQPPAPAPGQVVKDAATAAFYQIVSAGAKEGEVSFIRQETKTKKAKVPAVIYHGGRKYKVTSVGAKAFAGNKKLKSVVIGKNVTKIQKKAFANCRRLTKVTVKSTALKKVAKNAFRGTGKALTVKAPKKKRTQYKKLFRGKGNKKLKVK